MHVVQRDDAARLVTFEGGHATEWARAWSTSDGLLALEVHGVQYTLGDLLVRPVQVVAPREG
jgi:hypothetical protein